MFLHISAAIEALTKDSILHRRDVKTLVKQHKDKGKEERERTKVESANGLEIGTPIKIGSSIGTVGRGFEQKTAITNGV